MTGADTLLNLGVRCVPSPHPDPVHEPQVNQGHNVIKYLQYQLILPNVHNNFFLVEWSRMYFAQCCAGLPELPGGFI